MGHIVGLDVVVDARGAGPAVRNLLRTMFETQQAQCRLIDYLVDELARKEMRIFLLETRVDQLEGEVAKRRGGAADGC